MDEENNTELKFHYYGVGVYADDAERVAKVTAFVQETFKDCEPESYVVREKAPAEEGKPRKGGTFGVALQAMKCGKGARRPGLETIRLHHGEFGVRPYFYHEEKTSMMEGVAEVTVFDMLQEDWEIVD